MNLARILWAAVILLGILTWFVELRLWMYSWQLSLVTALCAVSVAVGLVLMKLSAWRRNAAFIITLIVAVGQWWLIERALVYLLWSINGFAP